MPIIGSVRVGMSSAPSNPAEGELYYDTGDNILYNYTGATWLPVSAGTATGGTTNESGGYKYHTFTENGSFTVFGAIVNCEIWIIGGGGGGAGGHDADWFGGGAGGAGAILYKSGVLVNPGTAYACVLGAAGSGGNKSSLGVGNATHGANGGDTTFYSQTAKGGGRGIISGDHTDAADGGCGGGTGSAQAFDNSNETNQTVPSGWTGYNTNGGHGWSGGGYPYGGGGGGAAGNGGDKGETTTLGERGGGIGGSGIQINSVYYSCGGGGGGAGGDGGSSGGDGGPAGTGGGGAGGSPGAGGPIEGKDGGNATTYGSGGGGGCGGGQGVQALGGDGGDGMKGAVVIRYGV